MPPSPPPRPRRSAGGPAPRSSPSTTGSPPSTRIRLRSTTLSPPTKPSWTAAPPLRTSPSPESPPAAASPSPPRPEAPRGRVPDYPSGQDAALGLISPVFADLSGLPPLIIQAGTHEVLLDDAVRLARQAAIADVAVTLDITPKVPHVFQTFYPILDEAAAALDRAGQLLSAYLTSAERVTA